MNLIFVLSELKDPDKVVSRHGPNSGVGYVNFVEEKFSYLNITALGRDFVGSMPDCSFACLETPSCSSFNLGTIPDVNDRFRCELLPSDKYNNSDKFVQSLIFHHFSIAVSEKCRKQVGREIENQRSASSDLQVNLSQLVVSGSTTRASLVCNKLACLLPVGIHK